MRNNLKNKYFQLVSQLKLYNFKKNNHRKTKIKF